MPLTWQLMQESPLRRWFAARLRHIDDLSGIPTARLRPVVPRRHPDALPPWLIGMAFDWRLRIGIEVPADPWVTTAYAGWCQLRDALEGRLRTAHAVLASDGARAARNPVAQLLGSAVEARGETSGDRDETALARIAVALARYEACYRGGVRLDDPLVPLGVSSPVRGLLALCPDAAAEEIQQLTAAARRGLMPLFPAESIELNPDFTAYGTPADGDLIVDGLLLDLTTVSRPRLEAEWLWQVLGDVFLDEGRRSIDHGGIYLSRHAWLGTWAVDELVAAMAGEDVTEEGLRQEFLAVVGRSL